MRGNHPAGGRRPERDAIAPAARPTTLGALAGRERLGGGGPHRGPGGSGPGAGGGPGPLATPGFGRGRRGGGGLDRGRGGSGRGAGVGRGLLATRVFGPERGAGRTAARLTRLIRLALFSPAGLAVDDAVGQFLQDDLDGPHRVVVA